MKTDIKKILNLNCFFNIVKSSSNCTAYSLKLTSRILIKNIYFNWMQYTYSKTYKEMPVYLNKTFKTLNSKPVVYGYIEENLPKYDDEHLVLKYYLNNNDTSNSELKLNLIFPKEDAMQYFIKWQRYRKYWWSSISTTPSLFKVHDIQYQDKSANVDIVAQLSEGIQTVENVSINFEKDETSSQLSCSMCLENALKVLLLDGLTNNSKSEYLRLHRLIAPYKISFALDSTETDKKNTLKELAIVLHHKLQSNKISSWLPDFTQSYELQLRENLHMGVTYTAILSDDALNNGIFRLMNSSTMLGEQVHISDFHKYAVMLFEK